MITLFITIDDVKQALTFRIRLQTSLLLLISALSTNWGCLIHYFNLTGFLWPLEGAPIWLRYVGYALPQTFSIEATRSIMLRGWSLEYQTVWLSIVISIVWIIIFNILSVIILRLRRWTSYPIVQLYSTLLSFIALIMNHHYLNLQLIFGTSNTTTVPTKVHVPCYAFISGIGKCNSLCVKSFRDTVDNIKIQLSQIFHKNTVIYNIKYL